MAASVTAVLLNSFWGRLVPRFGRRAPALERVTLTIPSIHCHGCVTTIRETLGKLPLVVTVDGDPTTKEVTVTMRDGHDGRAAIEEALTGLGHVIGEK